MKRGQPFKRIETYIRNGSFSVLGARPEITRTEADDVCAVPVPAKHARLLQQLLEDLVDLHNRTGAEQADPEQPSLDCELSNSLRLIQQVAVLGLELNHDVLVLGLPYRLRGLEYALD